MAGDAFSYCQDLVREADRDRFLSALFAPEAARPGLMALYAFNVEIARIAEIVSNPVAGEIRLQWWRDVLSGEARGDAEANPVAAALLASCARHHLPQALFDRMLEARRFDLYDDPMASLADLERYAENTSAVLLELSARILASQDEPGVRPLMHHAGLAYGLAALMRAIGPHAKRGRVYLPLDLLARHGSGLDDVLTGRGTEGLCAALAELRAFASGHLAQARSLAQTAPEAIMPALLPVRLARAWLERMDRPGYEPFVPVEIAPLRAQWMLWRAARRPSRIFG